MATVVEHRKFVFARGRINSNKVWEVMLYDNNDVEVRYGRVGATMQSKKHAGAGRDKMEKLIRDKTTAKDHYDGGCYQEVKTLDALGASSGATVGKSASVAELKTIAATQIASCPTTRKLVEFFTEVNAHNIHQATGGRITYDTSAGTFKTPIGIVTSDNIDAARLVLDEITDAINKGKFGLKYDEKVEQLLMLIPQAVPRKFVPKEFVGTVVDVQKQSDILDGLAASVQAVMATPKNGDAKKAEPPKLFDCQLSIEDDKKQIDQINAFFNKGRQSMHVSSSMRLRNAYKVVINPMVKAFEKDGAKMSNRQQLWHGTSAANLLSILKNGFIIPPSTASHVCGRMFGNGAYFANSSTKSLNYSTGYWGGRDSGRYFMFLNDVALGKYYTPSGPTSSKPPAGYDSYWAKAGKSGVQNDELIVFRTSQINPLWLTEWGK